MKKTWILSALLCFSLIACDARKEQKEDNSIVENTTESNQQTWDKTALNKEFETLNGDFVSLKNILAQHQGKTILIDVWASWCPDCIKGFPALKELQQNQPDVVYIFLSLDRAKDKWKTAIEKYDLRGEHYYLNETMKGEFGQSINLDWIPRYILVDAEGNIALKKAIVANDPILINTLDSLQTEK
ncbi:MAG TPA: TlpA disulfide reductase family protein [Flavobacterium sp.]|nr:TlpA disulfide reductase family protein [Flavobacterium sp.]